MTKAALYYHFASKEEIFRTLMQPILELQAQAMALIKEQPTLEAWGAGLTTLVQWVLPQRRLFELLENNQGPVRAITEKMMAGHGNAEPRVHARALQRRVHQPGDAARPTACAWPAPSVSSWASWGSRSAKRSRTCRPRSCRARSIDAINDVLRIGKTAPAPPLAAPEPGGSARRA